MKVEVTHSLCSGCKLCQLTCSLYQFGENNPKKAGIFVSSHLLGDGHYHVAVCDQCGDCAAVCPTGAIRVVDGAYQIDAEQCNWCQVCVHECAQGALVVPQGARTPIKCTACGECVELCPTGALALVG